MSIAGKAAERVVEIGTSHGYGAGLIWDDRLVVTNDHVATELQAVVSRPLGERSMGFVIARDRIHDLALLSVPSTGFAPLEVGPSPCVGELVLAIGHPLGQAYHVTMG